MDDPENLVILISEIVILLGFLALSAFFSSSETALFSLNKLQLKKMQQKEGENRQVKSIIKLLDDPQRTLITILTGNMFVNVAASSLATYLAIQLFGDIGTSIATGVMIFLILVFGEIVPKSLAVANDEKISRKVAKPIDIIASIILPLIKLFKIIINLLFYSLGKKSSQEKKRNYRR